MIAIVDYGVGNLFSLSSSLAALGISAKVTGAVSELAQASHVILPGVGAFEDAMNKLRDAGLAQVLCELAQNGKPLMGICLGMQLLFSESYEFGTHKGLGLIDGQVCSLKEDISAMGRSLKVPHMGWNPLQIRKKDCPILKYTKEGQAVYYVHSFYAKNCDEHVAAFSEYGVNVPGVVQNGRVFGTQFHPEKSGDEGIQILKAFAEV